MQVSWRSSQNVLRSRPVQGLLLFAGASIAFHAHAKESCVIRDPEMVQAMDLDACRPEPVTAAEKARVLQSLPVNGVVTHLGRNEQRKIEAIAPVLDVHGRAGVYEIRVISVPQAWTGLYQRTVLLISLHALTLVSSEEIAALVAHEIGHEYVWQQYADAKAHGKKRELRELELACDAIALRTLARLRIPFERLDTATEKILWYNRERLGLALDAGNYPSLSERRRLIERMSLLKR